PDPLPLGTGPRRRQRPHQDRARGAPARGPPGGVHRGITAWHSARGPGGGDRERGRGERGARVVSAEGKGRIRAGVVGAGDMGQYHILALAELWDVDLVAICDTDVERARSVASQYSVRSVSTHHELAGLVDIAPVAVPTDRPFDVARELPEAAPAVPAPKPPP